MVYHADYAINTNKFIELEEKLTWNRKDIYKFGKGTVLGNMKISINVIFISSSIFFSLKRPNLQSFETLPPTYSKYLYPSPVSQFSKFLVFYSFLRGFPLYCHSHIMTRLGEREITPAMPINASVSIFYTSRRAKSSFISSGSS